MREGRLPAVVWIAALAAGCGPSVVGSDFPSATTQVLRPYQVAIDTGD